MSNDLRETIRRVVGGSLAKLPPLAASGDAPPQCPHASRRRLAPALWMMEPCSEKLLARLADTTVEFIVVGGVAVTLHGYTRLTEDVDILIRRTPENVARLLTSLAGYGEGFARELTADDFSDEEGAIRIVEETEQSQIDIFTRLSGLRYDDVIGDAPDFDLGGRTIRYASKATLLRLKETSAREKDRLGRCRLAAVDDRSPLF